MNQQPKNVYQKLQTVQAKTDEIIKIYENKFGKYKYFTEKQALRIIKPLLNENGLTLTFSDCPGEFKQEKGDKEYFVGYCKLATLTNADLPSEQQTYHFWATGQNTDIAKAKGSAETYAIKYFLTKFFMIPVTDENDPDRDRKESEVEPSETDKATAAKFLQKHGFNKVKQ